MTNKEFSELFDILLNSYGGQGDTPELNLIFDEYEKSVFLTLAQDEIIRLIYSGEMSYLGFELTEELRAALSKLVITKTLESTNTFNNLDGVKYEHSAYTLPSDIWYVVYEQVNSDNANLCGGSSILSVIPVTHDNYYHTVSSPFRGPNNKRILRLDLGNGVFELVHPKELSITYTIRYLKDPDPIILIDLTHTNLKIKNKQEESQSLLCDALHPTLLSAAVTMAKNSKISETTAAQKQASAKA